MFKADEATEYTRELVEGKIIRVKLLRKDQYHRAVAKVQVRYVRLRMKDASSLLLNSPLLYSGSFPFTKQDLSLKLAEQGLATLYTGGGAEYDAKLELIEKKIQLAKKKKRGVWENGGHSLETPAEFKRKLKGNNNKNKVKPSSLSSTEAARVY